MTTLVEGTHPGGFLVWEAFRDYTRETITVAAGTLEPGTVLGKIADLRRIEVVLAATASRCSGAEVPECPVLDAIAGEGLSDPAEGAAQP